MITDDILTKIENKLKDNDMTLNKLARKIHCSCGCLKAILYLKKDNPRVEKKLSLWLEDKLIVDFNYEDFIKDRNYIKNKLKERNESYEKNQK